MTTFAKPMVCLGLLLLAVGLVPMLATMFVFTSMDPLIPFLLSLGVAPLGAIILLAGGILWLAARLRGHGAAG